MISILIGTDRKKISAHLTTLVKGREFSRLAAGQVTREMLMEYATSVNLFGEQPIIVLDSVLVSADSSLTASDMSVLQKSFTTFIFLEDTVKVADEKKYKKYGEVAHFDEVKKKEIPRGNVFALTDAYGKKDKVGAWILYREAIEKGTEPEAICGLLFWKIKSFFTSSQKVFSTPELKRNSSALVSLYHRAHKGETDFTIGLEQFILSSLSK